MKNSLVVTLRPYFFSWIARYRPSAFEHVKQLSEAKLGGSGPERFVLYFPTISSYFEGFDKQMDVPDAAVVIDCIPKFHPVFYTLPGTEVVDEKQLNELTQQYKAMHEQDAGKRVERALIVLEQTLACAQSLDGAKAGIRTALDALNSGVS